MLPGSPMQNKNISKFAFLCAFQYHCAVLQRKQWHRGVFLELHYLYILVVQYIGFLKITTQIGFIFLFTETNYPKYKNRFKQKITLFPIPSPFITLRCKRNERHTHKTSKGGKTRTPPKEKEDSKCDNRKPAYSIPQSFHF